MNATGHSPAALHEAALAVVAHLHGLRIHRLRLDQPGSGHELLDALRYGLDIDRLDPERHFVDALKRIEVSLAGRTAVEHYLGKTPADGEAERIATQLLDRLCASARQVETLKAFARCRLLDLLDMPVHREMIEDLAARLDTAGEVDREEFMLVVLRTVKLPL
ncbi:MAG: hypothetical protein R3298_02140 [Gammaproteobacteria bacterium]|nr:hypothetical protein [Gammaproteobacteria bacterium]